MYYKQVEQRSIFTDQMQSNRTTVQQINLIKGGGSVRSGSNAPPVLSGKSISQKDLLRSSGGNFRGSLQSGSPAKSRRNFDLSSLNQEKKESESSKTYQIVLDVKVFMCSSGEPSELYISLYNMDQKKFISEELRLLLTAQGMPQDVTKINNMKVIFKDVTPVDMSSELYVVCKVLRRGKIVLDPKAKAKKGAEYKRPFACAVLKLNSDKKPEDRQVEEAVSYTMPVWTAASENEIANLHEMIPRNQNLVDMPLAKGVAIGLTTFKGSYEDFISKVPTLQDATVANRLGFTEIIMPDHVRHDFYVKLVSGEFAKTEAIEVSAFVRHNVTATFLPAIVQGAGDTPVEEFKSCVINKEANPAWGDLFSVQVNEANYANVHLYFTCRIASDSSSKDKEFAFGFIPLITRQGTVLPDMEHVVPLFSLPKSSEESLFYLKSGGEKTLAKLARKEQIKIKTTLCSTKLTTDQAIYSLLRWKTLDKSQIPDILNKLTYAHPVEVLKFLRETLDAMFQILDAGLPNIDRLVTNALVSIINILLDEKKAQTSGIDLKPVLDSYISNNFSSIEGHLHLMKALKAVLEESREKKQVSQLIAVLKNFDYLLKFIVSSQLRSVNSGVNNVSFMSDLLAMFQSVNALMARTDPEFRGPQVNAIKNFGSAIMDLGRVFDVSQLSALIRDFVDSIQYDQNLKLHNMEKLYMLGKLLRASIFKEEVGREIITPLIMKNIAIHLGGPNEEEKCECITVLNSLLYLIESKYRSSNLLAHVVPYLPVIMKALPKFTGQARLDSITCFLTTFLLMKSDDFINLFEGLRETDEHNNFILKVFQNFQSFVLAPPYPSSWFALTMTQYNVMLKVVMETTKYLAKINTKNIVPDQKGAFYDDGGQAKHVSALEVWKQCFRLGSIYIQSKVLNGIADGGYSQDVIDKCTRFRMGMLMVIKNMWNPLSEHKPKFLSYIVVPFLEFQFIPQPELQDVAADLYFSTLECEYEENKIGKTGNYFPKVETFTIDALEKMSSKGQIADDEMIQKFLGNLEKRVQNCADSSLKTKGIKFAKDVRFFLQLLEAIRTLPDGPEYEDDRTEANMKLMEYLKESNRKDAYIRSIGNLANQHLRSLNYVEAGEALLLHANMYKWIDEKVPELSGEFPAQSQRERREILIRRAIDLFDQGKMWEKAIELAKELRHEYNSMNAGEKFHEINELHNGFKTKILTEARFFTEYFRVGYYGKGFDANLRGKEFVYRGLELERRDEFIERIKALFPNAEILMKPELPGNDITDGPGQHLQIIHVQPSSQEESEGLEKTSEISRFHEGIDVNVFCFSRPLRKEKSENSFKGLWVLNTYYFTEDTFPTIHRRSPIKKTVQVEVNPLDNAIKAVKDKNKEIATMTSQVEKNEQFPLMDYTRVLQGVVAAAVNGGTDMYKDAFFNAEYLEANPDHYAAVQDLKLKLQEQIAILRQGLVIHELRSRGSQMSGLHQLLEEKFRELEEQAKTIQM
eukprot:TRINITY_DN6420_c0_g1_i1.p1 TRINITY_DN6420_c0_g1~~TRINITY_DN6420_c0_g1_i1.p1  ORF type:complete len:1484 (+),score=565.54 TRINITY_DN6420_c0_g1_i1:731-5182(+)